MLQRVKKVLSDNKVLLCICFIGLLLRLIYLWEYSHLPDWEQLTVDNNFHHHWALSILDGNLLGDTTYFRAPFYIFYLALIYKLFGISLWTVRICAIAIGLTSIILTYLTAKRIFSNQTGLIAAAIHAIYPIIYYFESELLLDPFFMMLLQAAMLFFIRWWDTRSYTDILVCGFLVSAASITRPTALLLIPLCLFWIIILERKHIKKMVLYLALFLVTAASLIGGTFYRNIKVANDPVLIASQGGINLYLGNNAAADGLSAVMPQPLGFNWRIKQISFIAEQEVGKQLTQGEISDYWTNKAIDWMKANPKQFFTLYLKKLYYSISDLEISNNRYLHDFFSKVYLLKYNYLSFGILFALAVMTCITFGFKDKRILFIVLFIVLYIVGTSLFFFTSRFRLPLLPFYIMLAAQSLYCIRLKIIESKKSASIYVGSTILIGLISFIPFIPLPKGSATDILMTKGIFYTSRAEYETALQCFSTAYEIDSELPELNLNIGAMYIRKGQIDTALTYIKREIALHPDDHKAYNNLSSALFTQNNFGDALIAAKKALEIAPYDLIANQLFIRSTYRIDTSRTAQYFQQMVRLAVNRTDYNIYLMNECAVYLSNRSLYSQAVMLLQQALKTTQPPIAVDDASFLHDSPNTPVKWSLARAQSYYQLGYIYGLQGKFSEAILHSKRAIELDRGLEEAYVNLISGYLSTGQIPEATKLLEEALQRFPTNPNLLKIQQLVRK